MKKLIIAISCLLISASSFRAMPPACVTSDAFIVGILGQSNASGRGGLGAAHPVDPNWCILGDNYRMWAGQEPSDKKGTSVDTVNYDSSAAYSAAWSMVQELHATTEQPIITVNVAKGSTSIVSWLPSRDENTLFGAAVKRLHTAETYGTVKLIYWNQGETDAQAAQAAVAPVWDQYFQVIVDALQEEFPEAQIVFAQTGPTTNPTGFPNIQTVRDRQDAFALSNPDVCMFTTLDLTLNPDGIHFNHAAQDIIGQRVILC